MRVKSKINKITAAVIVATMSMALVPNIIGDYTVSADVVKGQSNTCLGTSKIASPVAPANASSAWSGSYVYYGSYEGTPIKFRVLAPNTTAYGGTTMFLDSDSTLFNDYFDKARPYSNAWDDSDIRGVLNGSFLTVFTSIEQGAIAISSGSGGLSYANPSFGATAYSAPVSVNDKVFLLDATEVMNPAYGYSSDCGHTTKSDWTWESCYNGDWSRHNVASRGKGSSAYWWLRSASTSNPRDAGFVYPDGSLDFDYVFRGDRGVAPALNIDLSKILFSTAINGTMGKVGTSYKLTILDNSLSVTAGTVSMSGSKFSCTATGNADQVSLLITDGAWNASGSSIKYYGSYTGSFDLSSISLNASDWGTKYHVYLIAEDINGDKTTDYASRPVSIERPPVRNGWVTEGDKTYYYDDNGNKVTGWQKLSYMVSGRTQLVWFYFDPNGVMLTGKQVIDGKTYLFYATGFLATGWTTVGNTRYYCTKDDGLATGWKEIKNEWYYFDSNGAMKTGWTQVSGTWYYLNSEGVMQKEWQQIGGSWYYLGGSGAMRTGWQKINDVWYYLGSNGAMRTGWQQIGGVWYYFKSSGAMAANEWCEGYWLNADGSWTYKYKGSWKQDSKGWWFGDTSGWYAKSQTITIDGKSYTFDANGYWTGK